MVSIEYVDSAGVYFRDDTFRWLDAARFAISGFTSEPVAVLEALLRHDQYLDHYMTANDVACTPEAAAERARHMAPIKAKMMRQVQQLAGVVVDDQPFGSPRQLHGPYYAEFVTPERFDRLDATAALQTVTAWLREAGGDLGVPPVDQVDGDLAGLIATVEAFAEVYRLQNLSDAAIHDYGFVIQPYLELVGIDVHGRNLWLVAGGTD